ncbi:MaoC family dehydratase [Actinocorallia longicatena]|uniref:MaoC family dehydratase n=1 Tax=Actinocorallia longicatena TaxID=111803 RepID=A0ABP6Q3I7_9ACTN
MIFEDLDALAAAVGTELGTSGWITIDQERIDKFADATEDQQWIHVDEARAAEGPYGRTIAHGFLTLSLISQLGLQVMEVRGVAMGINYGLGRVRFITPVPVGSRVRGRVGLTEAHEVPGGLQITRTITIEIEGETRPACVAESLVRYLR